MACVMHQFSLWDSDLRTEIPSTPPTALGEQGTSLGGALTTLQPSCTGETNSFSVLQ